MPPGILGSLITGGASLLGSALGFGSQASTNAANMELAKYQYEKNLEMWHLNNLYNSPQAQMRRLKNAGLNPNLVYGNGAVGNASSTPPQFEAPTMQAYTNFGDLGASAGVDAYLRTKMQEAQITRLGKENEKTDSEISVLNQDALLKESQILLNQLKFTTDKTKQKFLVQELQQLADLRRVNFLDTLSRIKFRDNVQAPNVQSDTELKLIEIGLAPQKLAQMKASIELLRSQRSAQLALADMYKKQGRFAEANAIRVETDNELAKEVKEAKRRYGVTPDGSMPQQVGYLIYRLYQEALAAPWGDVTNFVSDKWNSFKKSTDDFFYNIGSSVDNFWQKYGRTR